MRAQLQAQGRDPAQAEAALAAMQDAAATGEPNNVQDMSVMEALLRSLVSLLILDPCCRQPSVLPAQTCVVFEHRLIPSLCAPGAMVQCWPAT